MENTIEPGIYKHFKGGYVMVLLTAKHSDREEIEVIYKGLNNGKFYARPVESFCEIIKDAQGNDVARFTQASKEEVVELLDENSNEIYNTFC